MDEKYYLVYRFEGNDLEELATLAEELKSVAGIEPAYIQKPDGHIIHLNTEPR